MVIEAGQGDDAQASEQLDAMLDGDDIEIAFNPQYLLDGLGALHHPFARLAFTQSTKPALLTGQAEAGRRVRRQLPVRADAGAAGRLTPPRAARVARTRQADLRSERRDESEGSQMKIGLIGLGKMGGNMRTRLRAAGIEVVGYDRNADISDADVARGDGRRSSRRRGWSG